MSNRNDSRYDEILRRMAQREREQSSAPQQEGLAGILDQVNAWGFLEELQSIRLAQINCYGPKSVRGYVPALWAGVVLWCKPRGYYFYQTLTLLGIWAYEEQSITVGTKSLEFTAPVFSAESYYHHIKRRFDLHYQDDGSPPPPDSRLYTVQYVPSKRLAIRDAIEHQLVKWAEAYQ